MGATICRSVRFRAVQCTLLLPTCSPDQRLAPGLLRPACVGPSCTSFVRHCGHLPEPS